MEESKELEKLYTLFRGIIYVSVLVEIGVYIPNEWLGEANFVFDRIRTFSIYQNVVFSKLFTILIVIITSIGTKAKKRLDFDINKMVFKPLIIGLTSLIVSVWLLWNNSGHNYNYYGYMLLSLIGILFVHVALDSLSKIIKDNLGQDKFNFENESFDQHQELKESDISINIPTKYYYKGKMRDSWINVENPFRGTWVLGTPGSGKTFSIIEPVIRQHARKGFSMVVYDYKFPSLATKLYYHYLKAVHEGNAPEGCKFRMINFTKVEYSHRINPIQKKYIPNLAAASETASTLIESLKKGQQGGGGADDFFKKSAENYLAAIIYFFTRYEDGKYSSMAHVLALLNQDYKIQFDLLMTNREVQPLLAPFMTALKNKAMDQLEGMIGTLRVDCSRLATKEAFWIFSGDDFDLKVSDPKNPSYLLIANDPEMESINSSLNALIINRLVTRVNSGAGKNIPVNIIIDELPTIYFHKIDRLIGTARSNKVAVTLGFQELPQLESDYGKIGMQKVISVCANVICASARNKETLDWLSSSIFGKVKQIKKGVSIDHNKTSINLNEEMGDLVPASKIADMPTGFLCGQIARDFIATKTKKDGSIDIQEAEEFQTTKFYAKTNFNMVEIKQEEGNYPKVLPLVYDFGGNERKEELLTQNFEKILKEVEDICNKYRISK
ncbi:type IV secretory system conjugative DNA transfer family protein [Porphyromonas levii]|uniref:Type IV secretory system conjugative DNA transfer family protein n=1 Tax=Porphyromonas levii TaxID=28114 RepID=A0A4Y8WPD5_9PORP|nr:type IV secretory system conjugative DNA transfer family protein [Porphyromonas levii]TFH94902.1 type IV secretory system conjugative DNA transfer family protein [Porphyromonas levii]TFH96828.1 type IV secretory system conjugative DNA transfer family protein [Porphyromonas levii]